MKFVKLLLIFAVTSCATMDFTSARAVQSKPGKGGVLTLNPPNDPKAREKADAIMRQTCGSKKPEITEEGDAVVGTSKQSSTTHDEGSGGIKHGIMTFGGARPSTNQDSVEKQVTEWRITYECKSSQA